MNRYVQRHRHPAEDRLSPRALWSDRRGDQDCGRRNAAMNEKHVTKLIQSVSQLTLPPSQEESMLSVGGNFGGEIV